MTTTAPPPAAPGAAPPSARDDRVKSRPLVATLLFAATGIVLLGSLIVFVWQYLRNNRKD